MKRKLLILFIALLAIACNGQQSSKENVKPLTEQEALEAFKKQKHRFEIKGYKIYYNDQLMKLDSVTHFIKRMGDCLEYRSCMGYALLYYGKVLYLFSTLCRRERGTIRSLPFLLCSKENA